MEPRWGRVLIESDHKSIEMGILLSMRCACNRQFACGKKCSTYKSDEVQKLNLAHWKSNNFPFGSAVFLYTDINSIDLQPRNLPLLAFILRCNRPFSNPYFEANDVLIQTILIYCSFPHCCCRYRCHHLLFGIRFPRNLLVETFVFMYFEWH